MTNNGPKIYLIVSIILKRQRAERDSDEVSRVARSGRMGKSLMVKVRRK